MGHVSDGVLRRLEDEPFAVPDTAFAHVAGCGRCRARRDHLAGTARAAAEVLAGPQLVPDVDRAWAEFQGRRRHGYEAAPSRRRSASFRPRRVLGVSARAAVIGGVATAALVGAAGAATVTTVFAPTHVAPVKVTAGDLGAMTELMSIGGTGGPGGFPTPAGTGSLPFGSLHWSTSGSPQRLTSLAAAEAASGMAVALPSRLPNGVGAPTMFLVQPKVTATVTFDRAAGRLDGATARLTLGPVVLVAYGAPRGSPDVPTLAVVTLPRPTGSTTGASISQVESFLLSRPDVPPELAQEIRLLGDPSTTLPIPTPAGMTSKPVSVAANRGLAISDPSGLAAAVVWEDGGGVVHAVGGLISEHTALQVADDIAQRG